MRKIGEYIIIFFGYVVMMGGCFGLIMLAQPTKEESKPEPPKIYDVRANDLGKQFIYKNDSVYITHVTLDSVIKDSVERDECPCSSDGDSENDPHEFD